MSEMEVTSEQLPVTHWDRPKSELEELAGALILARKELMRRLRSTAEKKEINTTSLMRFTIDATKLVAQVDQTEKETAEQQATHALTIIRSQGLPLNRQLEMIEAMIAEVGPDRSEEMGLTAALAMLLGEINAVDAVEEESGDEEN